MDRLLEHNEMVVFMALPFDGLYAAVVTRAGPTAGAAEVVWVTRLRRELGLGG